MKFRHEADHAPSKREDWREFAEEEFIQEVGERLNFGQGRV